MKRKEISYLTGMHKRTILRRTKKEGWPYVVKRGNGGEYFDYPLASLPADIRRKLIRPELIRDRTLDWFERMMNSPWLERACWGVIVLAALYFSPVIMHIIIER